MEKELSKVTSLKVGKIETKVFGERSVQTAINKKKIDSSFLTKTGFKDDEQSDLKNHGGENKALMFFSSMTYDKLSKEIGQELDYSYEAPMGENILVENLCEDDICVGDIFKIGDARIQITQPREPCMKVSINTQNKQTLYSVYENGYTGWYAKVLQEGDVKEGDKIILLQREYENLVISKLNQALVKPKDEKSLIEDGISCEALGKPFKEHLEKLLMIHHS